MSTSSSPPSGKGVLGTVSCRPRRRAGPGSGALVGGDHQPAAVRDDRADVARLEDRLGVARDREGPERLDRAIAVAGQLAGLAAQFGPCGP